MASVTLRTLECITNYGATVSACLCHMTRTTGLTYCLCIRIGRQCSFPVGIFLSSFFRFLRVKHGPQQSVPEGMFDDSINLVVWGHEHDCRIDPEPVAGKGYMITQPGSSVATSLAEGESLHKWVVICIGFILPKIC